jgi:hypothetical protein
MAGNTGFDLNINNYSVDDLFDIYKIRKNDQGNVSEDFIQKATSDIIQKYYESSGSVESDDEYVNFFNNARTRILQHLQSGSAFINGTINHQAQYGGINNTLIGGEQNVMMSRDETYQNSFHYEYPKGTINPVERRTITRIVSIDTLFRTNYYKTKSTDFIWNLPTPINNVVSLQIVSAQIPNMIRTFSNDKRNNKFIVKLYNVYSGGDSPRTYSTQPQTRIVTIPDGVYMADTFAKAMNNYFANDPINSGEIISGLRFLYIEVNDKTTNTIIRARDSNDTDYTDSPRPFKTTDPYYSPKFYFTLDFNIPEDKSVTPYYNIDGPDSDNAFTIIRKRASPPDISGSECKSGSFQRTHMTSKNIECFRPNISPIDGLFTNSHTKMRPLYKNAGWMMGFRKDYYDSSGNPYYPSYITTSNVTGVAVVYQQYIKSESSYGSTIPQYFFIELDDFNRNFTSNTIIAESGNGAYLGNNIVARIPINSSTFNVIHSNPSDLIYKRRDYFGPVKIEKLNLRLLDKYGDTLDIMNNDFAIAIELTTLY